MNSIIIMKFFMFFSIHIVAYVENLILIFVLKLLIASINPIIPS